MRLKGEDLYDCMDRNGWTLVDGAPTYRHLSSAVPGMLYTTWEKRGKRFSFGIGEAGHAPHPIVPPYAEKGKCPRCCRPRSEYKEPLWIKWLRLNFTPSGIRERRRSKAYAAHRARVMAWLHMDLKAEMRNVREQLAHP
jgi:hypothetical protein